MPGCIGKKQAKGCKAYLFHYQTSHRMNDEEDWALEMIEPMASKSKDVDSGRYLSDI